MAVQEAELSARAGIEGLQGRVTLVDELAPLGPESADEAWSGDADHLRHPRSAVLGPCA